MIANILYCKEILSYQSHHHQSLVTVLIWSVTCEFCLIIPIYFGPAFAENVVSILGQCVGLVGQDQVGSWSWILLWYLYWDFLIN